MKYISIFCLFIILLGCATGYHSTEFTPEGSFTSGIEGPATDDQGNLYAVNYKMQGTIGKVTPEGEGAVFVTLPNGSIGNGIRFGENQDMFVADYVNHNILKIDIDLKYIEVFAHEPNANQPNDIAIGPNNTIYASDPNWADSTGKLWKVTKENGFELLEDHMGTTNGIEVSPDGKNLYVNESVQRKIWVYDIGDDGLIKNKEEFISFTDFGLDGMRCDREGNLYVTRYDKGTILVLSPTGRVLKEYQLMGKKPSNLTFSPDFKTLYVTLADKGNIEVIRL
ncbi:sugar lactone lactonase YvrE [Gelidibacter sediminis]|uniref:Sugar lactone lactonase YvrE n=1 Tax=Gelidibacter sediminis TaxID=1608710 RepID=A0A4R7Q554_9FLAO|nr:SMP-30/gluconolactonase/LRE family protein [Gelidibacter sediminis]TDU42634.1 sugar lactone lactonase YvrE [Gelidibacter sediminis]